MYAVRCPHCSRLLQLNRPVENTKMKCRNCGQIFVGTTSEVSGQTPAEVLGPADPAAMLAASAAAPAPRRTKPKPGAKPAKKAAQTQTAGEEEDEEEIPAWRRPKPAWKKYMPVTITGITVVLLVVTAIFLYHVLSYPTVEIVVNKAYADYIRTNYRCGPKLQVVEEFGNNVKLRGPISRGEMAAIAKLEKEGIPRPEREGGAPPPPPVAARPEPGTQTPSGSGSGGEMREALPASDESVAVDMENAPIIPDDAPDGSGYLVGRVVSKAQFPIDQVEIDIYTHDSSGKRRSPIRTKVAYLPPGGTLRLCVPYSGIKPDELKDVGGVSMKPQKGIPSRVSWMIQTDDRKVADGKLILTYEVENKNDFPVKNVAIYFEIFEKEDGAQVGGEGSTKQGGLEGGATTIPAKGKAKATLTVDLVEHQLTALGARVHVLARVWAEQ